VAQVEESGEKKAPKGLVMCPFNLLLYSFFLAVGIGGLGRKYTKGGCSKMVVGGGFL